jgi:hypothetical protein
MAAMADLAAKLVREERQQQRGSVGGTEADAEAEAQVTAEVVSEVWNILLPGEEGLAGCWRCLCAGCRCLGAGLGCLGWLSCVAQLQGLASSTGVHPAGLSDYDAPQSLPLLAPRPLLIANGELDPRCPMKVPQKAPPQTPAHLGLHPSCVPMYSLLLAGQPCCGCGVVVCMDDMD